MGKPKPNAWLVRRKLAKAHTYDLRWIDPQTGKFRSQNVGSSSVRGKQLQAEKIEALGQVSRTGKIPDKSLSDLIAALPVWFAGKSPETVRLVKQTMEAFKGYAGDRPLNRINRELIINYRSFRVDAGKALATINKNLREIKSVLTYAVDAGWLKSNPLLRWRHLFLKEPEQALRVVEPEEFKKLLAACRWPNCGTLLELAFYQGLRRKELVQLRWVDIDFERAQLAVRNKKSTKEFTKSRKNRILPLRVPVLDALKKQWKLESKLVKDQRIQARHPHVFHWDDGRPIKPDWVSREFARVVQRAGIAHCTIHDLRRSFSTLAQRAGVDRSTIKDLGGWSCLAVVEKHYTGEIDEVLRRAMKKLDAG